MRGLCCGETGGGGWSKWDKQLFVDVVEACFFECMSFNGFLVWLTVVVGISILVMAHFEFVSSCCIFSCFSLEEVDMFLL